MFSRSVLSLGLDHRGNSSLDSLMLAVWIHKTYMESYKRVIRPSSFTTEWKSHPQRLYNHLAAISGLCMRLADSVVKDLWNSDLQSHKDETERQLPSFRVRPGLSHFGWLPISSVSLPAPLRPSGSQNCDICGH